MTFIESLRDLRNHVGNRNARLTGVVARGIHEGLSPDQIAEAFSTEDCGSPPLTAEEVKRAISRSAEYMTGEANTNARRIEVAIRRMRDIREGTSPEERSFVPRMIEAGTKACGSKRPGDVLEALSPVSVAGFRSDLESIRQSALAYIKALFPDDSGFMLAIDRTKDPRTRERMFRPSELYAKIAEADVRELFRLGGVNPAREREEFKPVFVCPSHIGTNLYTGENRPTRKGGPDSFANKQTILTRSHALVEFDLTDTLREQVFFWVGVVSTGALNVRSIVYTRGKSFHGIVEVAEERRGDDLFGETSDRAREQKWMREIAALQRKCCSNEEVSLRADAACSDATRMTRFPGGCRYDEKGKYLRHALVYCAAPDSSNALQPWF